MTIHLNGEAYQTNAQNVAELLRELNTLETGVAVALNDGVVRRAEQETTELKEGDRVEIIRAVQGG